VKVFRSRAFEAQIVKKELNHIALPGTGPPAKSIDVTLRQRPEPSPRLAQRAGAARHELFNGRLAGEKAPGQRSQQQRIWHGGGRQNAPTSLTLREHSCAVAQRRSRDEYLVLHVPLG
jgi:hypothetical protein